MEIRLKLSPPWVTYVNKLQALFDGDPQIAFNIDNTVPSVTLAVNNADKATALAKLLPSQKVFGNIVLKINIDGPMSNRAFVSNSELFETAFYKNPAFSYVVAIDSLVSAFTYVVFKNCVVQFFNDNLNDIHGIVSTLYQDIAAEVFADAPIYGVVYNTDIEAKLGKPLGEWP